MNAAVPAREPEGTTLLSLFARQVRASGRRAALRYRSGGIWRARSWDDWRARSSRVAAWLVANGLEPGDRVAILADTCIEWVELDLGVLAAAGVTVAIYPSLLPDTVGEILRDSGAKVVVTSDPVQAAKLFDARTGELAALERVVSIAKVSRLDRPDDAGRLDVSLDDIVRGRLPAHTYEEILAARLEDVDLAALEHAVTPQAPAAILYTSGTDGHPKGVILTHDNFVYETDRLTRAIAVGPSDEQVLFLPLAHIVAKLTVMLQLRAGFVTSFARIDHAAEDCAEVRPTFLVGVPRIYEKLGDAIQRAPRERGEVSERVFAWALDVGRRVSALRQAGRAPGRLLEAEHRVADRLVYSKVKARLGGRLRFLLSGAAPLARETAELFHALDLLVLEGYGLTESTGASTLNVPLAYRFGTVGRPLEGVEVTLGADGEILLAGRSVTPGYWNDEAATAAAFDAEGRFHTGDVGELDEAGFLRITDRKKDLIITAGGKNIAPQRVELRLARSPLIARAVVLGDRRKFPVALLVVEAAEVERRAKQLELRGDLSTLLRHPKLTAALASEVERVNEGLASFERVKRFTTIQGDLSVADGTLTPTGKVRRAAVLTRYADVVDALYEGVTADLGDIG
ncbi:MAG: long-chain fatty acid--CoA ligase [Sandaracinaceae bacterium]|nr:long-chain fatty acid--CoA ligase [Sandaracinaceae bacterium]